VNPVEVVTRVIVVKAVEVSVAKVVEVRVVKLTEVKVVVVTSPLPVEKYSNVTASRATARMADSRNISDTARLTPMRMCFLIRHSARYSYASECGLPTAESVVHFLCYLELVPDYGPHVEEAEGLPMVGDEQGPDAMLCHQLHTIC